MNGKDLLEAMGQVEERYVDEAEYLTLRNRVPMGLLSAAACLCILIGGAMLWMQPKYAQDCAAPESNGSAEMQNSQAEGMTMAPTDGVMETVLTDGTAERPSVALRIAAWQEDSVVAVVCEQVADAEQLPLGQEVTVLFEETIRSNGEWRQPTEADFPVGSRVIVIFHSYQEHDGEVTIVVDAIMEGEE